MKKTVGTMRWMIGLSVVGAIALGVLPASGEERKPIYDEDADPVALVAAAVDRAQEDNKSVLIQWGGNWCGWCYKLHDLFRDDKAIAKTLLYEYELVLIDSKNEKFARSMGTTFRGVPYLTVLDADGQKLTDQDTGSLEDGPLHDPAKVLAFLENWTPEPVDALEVLERAKAQAKTDGKLIFVHFSTPWCGWCRKLEAFLDREDVSAILSRRYLIVKIDQERMLNGAKLRESIPRGSGGVPWHAVLDADGAALVTATGPQGNIGYPVAPREIAHFMSMLRDTRGDLSDADLDVIQRVLTEFAKKK